jgi:hypothetical protein
MVKTSIRALASFVISGKIGTLKTKLISTLSFLCFFYFTLNAQLIRKPVAASYPGSGAYSLNYADVFSFISNQASLAQLKHTSVGVYGERRFFLGELKYYKATIGLLTRTGNFGLETGYYGFADYNETKLGLAYGRKLGSKLDIGAQFNYHGIRITTYGNISAMSFEIGTVMHLTEKFHAGVHVNNPVGGKFGKDQQEKLPAVYTAGVGFEASQKFLVSAEIQKEEDQPVNVNAGIQYKLLPQLLGRAGISSSASSAWIGAGVIWKSLRLDVVSGYHPQLGITPGLLLIFNFKGKES